MLQKMFHLISFLCDYKMMMRLNNLTTGSFSVPARTKGSHHKIEMKQFWTQIIENLIEHVDLNVLFCLFFFSGLKRVTTLPVHVVHWEAKTRLRLWLATRSSMFLHRWDTCISWVTTRSAFGCHSGTNRSKTEPVSGVQLLLLLIECDDLLLLILLAHTKRCHMTCCSSSEFFIEPLWAKSCSHAQYVSGGETQKFILEKWIILILKTFYN